MLRNPGPPTFVKRTAPHRFLSNSIPLAAAAVLTRPLVSTSGPDGLLTDFNNNNMPSFSQRESSDQAAGSDSLAHLLQRGRAGHQGIAEAFNNRSTWRPQEADAPSVMADSSSSSGNVAGSSAVMAASSVMTRKDPMVGASSSSTIASLRSQLSGLTDDLLCELHELNQFDSLRLPSSAKITVDLPTRRRRGPGRKNAAAGGAAVAVAAASSKQARRGTRSRSGGSTGRTRGIAPDAQSGADDRRALESAWDLDVAAGSASDDGPDLSSIALGHRQLQASATSSGATGTAERMSRSAPGKLGDEASTTPTLLSRIREGPLRRVKGRAGVNRTALDASQRQQEGSEFGPSTSYSKVLNERRSRIHALGRAERVKIDPSADKRKAAERLKLEERSEARRRTGSGLLVGSGPFLTLAQEQALMALVEDLRFLQGAQQQLRDALHREPSMEELAMTCMTDVGSLMTRLHQGNAARDTMTRSNYRLVLAIARKYARRPNDMPDLIATGLNGIYKAVDKFEVSKGFRFSTYATWWIRQAIMRNLSEQSRVLRLPSHLVEYASKLQRLRVSMEQELERPPTDEELAKAMNLTPAKVRHLIEIIPEAHSLDIQAPQNPDGDLVGDAIEDTRGDAGDYLESEALEADVVRMLAQLDSQEAAVLRMRYGLDRGDGATSSMEVVSRTLKLSRERIRQIEIQAIRKLRKAHAEQPDSILRDYERSRSSVELAPRQSRGTQKT